MMNNRISIFISLPMITLDKLALQRRLDEIGRNMPKGGTPGRDRSLRAAWLPKRLGPLCSSPLSSVPASWRTV